MDDPTEAINFLRQATNLEEAIRVAAKTEVISLSDLNRRVTILENKIRKLAEIFAQLPRR